jgi:hypothetical protein
VNPADGLYAPFPDTIAEPTTVPPLTHEVGAEAWGPNTVNVTVPVGDEPPDNVPDTDDPEIADPAVPDAGPDTDNAGLAAAVSSVNAFTATCCSVLLSLTATVNDVSCA